MDDDLRYTVSGAAIGAIVGALVGWLFFRGHKPDEAGLAAKHELSPRSAFNLGLAVLAIVRQIADM